MKKSVMSDFVLQISSIKNKRRAALRAGLSVPTLWRLSNGLSHSSTIRMFEKLEDTGIIVNPAEKEVEELLLVIQEAVKELELISPFGDNAIKILNDGLKK